MSVFVLVFDNVLRLQSHCYDNFPAIVSLSVLTIFFLVISRSNLVLSIFNMQRVYIWIYWYIPTRNLQKLKFYRLQVDRNVQKTYLFHATDQFFFTYAFHILHLQVPSGHLPATVKKIKLLLYEYMHPQSPLQMRIEPIYNSMHIHTYINYIMFFIISSLFIPSYIRTHVCKNV